MPQIERKSKLLAYKRRRVAQGLQRRLMLLLVTLDRSRAHPRGPAPSLRDRCGGARSRIANEPATYRTAPTGAVREAICIAVAGPTRTLW